MGLVIISFVVVFLLIASGALLVFYRDALPQRIAEAINPRPKKTECRRRDQRVGIVDRRRR